MVLKCLTQSRFSFGVRMKRLAQPLHSGMRIKEGEDLPPSHLLSFECYVPCVECRDRGAGGNPRRYFTGCSKIVFDTLIDGLRCLETVLALGRVNANTLPRAVVVGNEYSSLAFFSRHSRRHIRAPHRVDGFGNHGSIVCY